MKRLLLFLTVISLSVFTIGCDDDDDTNNTNNTNQEICDNQTDDDGDDLIDCDDDDCVDAENCQVVEICDNGEDDDGDDLIDCDDDDCANTVECPMIKHITVIGTSDIHSHLMGVGSAYDYSPLTTNDDDTKSGLARIGAVIKNIRATKDASEVPYVTVDSGDFLMGDMVDFLGSEAPPVLHFFQLMQYDAVTLGNHDFDWTPDGAALIINAGIANEDINFNIPLLSSNIVTDATSDSDNSIEALIAGNVIRRYVIKAIDDDFSVGIYGVMGVEADSNVPQAKPLTWWHEFYKDEGGAIVWDTEQYQALIDEMKDEGAHMVVQAGHAGSNSDTTGEDRDVASHIDGVDVIMSGHRHQVITSDDGTFKVGDTVIMATGRNGEWVSQLDVAFNVTTETVEDSTGILHAIDDTVEGDPVLAAIMGAYITGLDTVLEPMGFTYSASPIATTTFDVATSENIFYAPAGTTITPYDIEKPAGMLIADAQRSVMNTIIGMALDAGLGADPTFDSSPIEIVFIETGAVRDPILKGLTGNIAAADAFRAFPLGIGPDQLPGYPMLTFYLTPKEIGIILNMDVEAFKGNVPFEYYMVPSGLRYVYDDDGTQFDRVLKANICPVQDPFTLQDCFVPGSIPGGTGTPLDLTDETTLIRVSVDYYVALSLPEARNAFGENLTIDPKFKNGDTVDMTDSAQVASLRFNATPGSDLTELKAWFGLLKYLEGLEDEWSTYGIDYDEGEADGMPSIPRRVYDDTPAPDDVTDGMWNLGVFRNMEVTMFCSVATFAATNPDICPTK
ncbi:MAG: bifunctional metallophosphatase/5'-nucleotidase [Deltaproteobacteria bacterium]|nr:bifunctional metallophosphatase/5'-nucleotidase [Deltaproteobacteria bacterium]